MFATGIENSAPVVAGRNGQPIRVDEMAATGHYDRWRDDFALVCELGLEFLRYGPPYYLTHVGPARYDWAFVDEAFAELARLRITPIVDLCHFGVPDWIGDFQNPEWPALFAAYARAFASRTPWVRFYTPVNEIFVAATMSAQWGFWNERLRSDQAFLSALTNMVRATLLAEAAILEVQPNAIFVHSESTEYFHTKAPVAAHRAELFNEKRFLALDLCYGNDVRACMYQYMLDAGRTRDEYGWFMHHGRRLKPYAIMGNDYYLTNEHYVTDADGTVEPSGELFGYYVITKQYYDRYHLPVMHTETNLAHPEQAVEWLRKQWRCMVRLREDGVPIVGFTWYSLLDQVDWDSALREQNGNVDPLGLYDLERRIRPVGRAYQELVAQWTQTSPVETLCLCTHHDAAR